MIKSNTTACGAPRDLFRVPPSYRLARIPVSLSVRNFFRGNVVADSPLIVNDLSHSSVIFFRVFSSLSLFVVCGLCAQVSAFIIIVMRICGPDLFSAASVFEF